MPAPIGKLPPAPGSPGSPPTFLADLSVKLVETEAVLAANADVALLEPY